MNMIYNPKTGWREIEKPILIKENSERMLAAQEQENIEIVENLISNAKGYLEYLKSVENPIERRKQLDGFGKYLAKHIGPGVIGNWPL